MRRPGWQWLALVAVLALVVWLCVACRSEAACAAVPAPRPVAPRPAAPRPVAPKPAAKPVAPGPAAPLPRTGAAPAGPRVVVQQRRTTVVVVNRYVHERHWGPMPVYYPVWPAGHGTRCR